MAPVFRLPRFFTYLYFGVMFHADLPAGRQVFADVCANFRRYLARKENEISFDIKARLSGYIMNLDLDFWRVLMRGKWLMN